MLSQLVTIPPLPAIGLPEGHYAKLARSAERENDSLSRDAAKVGQYVTLAADRSLDWPEKLRYLRHTLERHCVPPRLASERVWMFYSDLANLVRTAAGHEILRIASREDDIWAKRLQAGSAHETLADEAAAFFALMLPPERPDWLNQDDYDQLCLIRNQWV